MEKPKIEHFNFFNGWAYAEQCNFHGLNEIVIYYQSSDFLFSPINKTVAIFKIKLKS